MKAGSTVGAETVARGFVRARAPEINGILETLAALELANREEHWA